jgi:CelD/BcsL family acetyltransferase involved in cellulose biosynthesis
MLYLALIETEDGPIAADFGFQDGGARYAYTCGYKLDDLATYSPGQQLDWFNIQDSIATARMSVDLMRGHLDYKQRYGVLSDFNVDLLIFRSRRAMMMERLYRGIKRNRGYEKLKPWAKRLLRRGH